MSLWIFPLRSIGGHCYRSVCHFGGQLILNVVLTKVLNSILFCHDPLPVVFSPVAAASQDLVEAGDKAEVIIIKLRNFDNLT